MDGDSGDGNPGDANNPGGPESVQLVIRPGMSCQTVHGQKYGGDEHQQCRESISYRSH